MATLTDKLNIEIFGDKELSRFFLKALKFGQQRSVFITAYKRAAAPIVRTAKANLKAIRKSKTAGSNLNKSIGTYASPGKVQLLIGARKFKGFKGFHGHLVDRGTTQRYRKSKTGAQVSTGKMPASNFWKKTLDSEAGNVGARMQNELNEALARFVDRNLQRINKVA